MSEYPVDGAEGFILVTGVFFDEPRRHVFRVYSDVIDPETGRRRFRDWEIDAEEIGVRIADPDGALALVEDGDDRRLTWSARAMGAERAND